MAKKFSADTEAKHFLPESSEELSHVQIERHFRRQLNAGVLAEGERLPTNAALAKRFKVSGWAVQNALARLASEGLIGRSRGRGTYVKSVTKRAQIAVLFGPSLAEESAYFYRAILKTLREEMEAYNWSLRHYDGLTDIQGVPFPVESPIFQHLLSDLRNYSFKGIIQFATGAKELEQLAAESSLPKFQFSDVNTDMKLDGYHFGRQAADYFAQNGRSKMMYARTVWAHESPVSVGKELQGLRDGARENGLVPPMVEEVALTQRIDWQEKVIYNHFSKVVREWKANPRKAPDALLVNDDIVARPICLALIREGIRVPRDLVVVTQASEGIDIHYGIPMIHYQLSPREISRRLLEVLWKRVIGKPLPPLPLIIRGRIVETEKPGRVDFSDEALGVLSVP